MPICIGAGIRDSLINKESDSATSATQEKCHREFVNHKPTSIHLSGMTGCSIQDGASLYF